MNLIRNPLDRYVSDYYFSWQQSQYERGIRPEIINIVSTCILNRYLDFFSFFKPDLCIFYETHANSNEDNFSRYLSIFKCKKQARIYHINHPAHAPYSPLYVRQKKINLRPPVQPDNLYSCAPRFNIFWIRA